MKTFIRTRLRQVLAAFLASAAAEGKLCELRKFNYTGHNLPDYTLPLVQQYYMLRYFPAYLAEYYLIYDQLLEFDFLDEPPNVLSIGAGCGLDFWGLHFAAKKYGRQVRYTGIDVVKWEQWDSLESDSAWMIAKDIATWTEFDEPDYNVVIFPKSIGEFSTSLFEHIKNVFNSTAFTKDKICLICSLRDKRSATDVGRFAALAKTIEDVHGYTCIEPHNQYYYYDENVYIGKECEGFDYPDDVRAEVTTTLSKCLQFAANGSDSCSPDCSDMNRFPILKTTYMKWQILRFERK